MYICRHPERGKIISLLRTRELLVSIHYPWPTHPMNRYAYLDYKEGDLPHTEKAALEIFNLPMYPALSNEEQKLIVSALHDILGDIK